MTIQEYFGDWSRVIPLTEADHVVMKLSKVSNSLCPKLGNVFKAFKLCQLNNLKVVILGQDPYPQKGIATGIAFANAADIPENLLSPSLIVLRDSVIDFTRPHGNINFDPSLEKWEEQGVLMLNSALSCEIGKPGSHSLLWYPFTKELLTNLSLHVPGIVYVLMGNQAQGFESYINKHFNYIIRCRHPAWYVRNKTKLPSDCWKQINDMLKGQNGSGIEWYEEQELGQLNINN